MVRAQGLLNPEPRETVLARMHLTYRGSGFVLSGDVTSAFSRALSLYINCVESDGFVTEVHLSGKPLGRRSSGGASSRIVDYIDRGEGDIRDINVKMSGTEFQKEVWNEIRQIPPGQTLTYGEVAKRVGRPGAARAVGTAMRSNHLVLLVPCHRVVSATGLGGYSAHGGLRTKRRILELESMHSLAGLTRGPDRTEKS